MVEEVHLIDDLISDVPEPNLNPLLTGLPYGNLGTSLSQMGYGMPGSFAGGRSTGYGPNYNNQLNQAYLSLMNQYQSYPSDPMLLMSQLYSNPNYNQGSFNSYLNNGYYMTGSLFPPASTPNPPVGPTPPAIPPADIPGGRKQQKERNSKSPGSSSRTEGLSVNQLMKPSEQRLGGREPSASPTPGTSKPSTRNPYYDPTLLSLLSMDLPPVMKNQLRHFSRANLMDIAQRMKSSTNSSPTPSASSPSPAIMSRASPVTATSTTTVNRPVDRSRNSMPTAKLPDFSSLNPPLQKPVNNAPLETSRNYLTSVPPSTTIEKVSLSNQQSPLDLQQRLNQHYTDNRNKFVPVSSTALDKAINQAKNAKGTPIQKRAVQPAEPPASKARPNQVQPTAIINLIDDVSESRPDLTVKPVAMKKAMAKPKEMPSAQSSISTSVIKSTPVSGQGPMITQINPPISVQSMDQLRPFKTVPGNQNPAGGGASTDGLIRNVNMGIKYPGSSPQKSVLISKTKQLPPPISVPNLSPLIPSLVPPTKPVTTVSKNIEVTKSSTSQQELIANLKKVPNSITLTPITAGTPQKPQMPNKPDFVKVVRTPGSTVGVTTPKPVSTTTPNQPRIVYRLASPATNQSQADRKVITPSRGLNIRPTVAAVRPTVPTVRPTVTTVRPVNQGLLNPRVVTTSTARIRPNLIPSTRFVQQPVPVNQNRNIVTPQPPALIRCVTPSTMAGATATITTIQPPARTNVAVPRNVIR